MKMLLKVGIRFIIYIMIMFPVIRGIFSGLGGIISFILAFIITAMIVSIIEVRGLMKKLVEHTSNLLGVTLKTGNSTLSNILGETIAPVESAVECKNCGSQITLKNGKGICPCCDTSWTSN